MKILNNGFFSITYTAEELTRGLRPSKRMPRNNKFLTKCQGAVGQDGVLRTLDSLDIPSAISDATFTTNDFPFPQLFVLDKHVILCNRTSIQELIGGEFTEVITGLSSNGDKWNVAAAFNWIYLSNNVVAVVRDPNTGGWAVDSDAPVNQAACNYKGHIIIGISA
jgi:hypothetical protein